VLQFTPDYAHLNMSARDVHRMPLLEVRTSLQNGLILVLAGPLLVLVTFLPTNAGATVRVFAFLFGVTSTGFGIRLLRNPAVLIKVTELGIMVHANREGVSVSPSVFRDLFIPWERVESMKYFNQKQARAADLSWVGAWGAYTDPCIVLRVRMEPDWPPPGTMRHDSRTRKAKPGEIYINASVCSPGGAQLWNRIKEIGALHTAAVSSNEP
jgi:hypothetical protein